MFSMAGASLFLPFLPLLPKQILLTNLLTDFPEMAISSDSVDPEMMVQPRRWSVSFIRKFMLTFGILSSLFDYATFAVLLLVLHATTTQFRTGWFLESVISAILIVMVIRTRKPVFRSVPGKVLLIATAAVALCTVILPYTPVGRVLGFGPLPAVFLVILALIVLAYLFAAEAVKRVFYKRMRF
jgi:Mg2+-importing ATPase